MSTSDLQPVKPPALRPGDTVGIVAPASNVKRGGLGSRLRRVAARRLPAVLSRLDPGTGTLFCRIGRAQGARVGRNVRPRRRSRDCLRARRLWRQLSAASAGSGKDQVASQDFRWLQRHHLVVDATSQMSPASSFSTAPWSLKTGLHEDGVDLPSWQAAVSGGAAPWDVPMGADVSGLVDGEGEGVLIRRMSLDPGRIAWHALRNQDSRYDFVSRRPCRQALSDRPHADAIETGRLSRRCPRHRLRRNARLRANRRSRLHSAGSRHADRRRLGSSRRLRR